MKSYISILIIFTTLLATNILTAQTEINDGWTHWTNGDIPKAQLVTEEVLENEPENNEALHLKALCLYVQGKYQESIETFVIIDPIYEKHEKLAKVIIEAYLHLNDLDNACKFSKEYNMKLADYYKDRKDKPFTYDADKTFIIPFEDDPQIPSKYMPGVSGKINGTKLHILFDTGGPFLVLGKDLAEELGIKLEYEGRFAWFKRSKNLEDYCR